jgi:hypothetical protein
VKTALRSKPLLLEDVQGKAHVGAKAEDEGGTGPRRAAESNDARPKTTNIRPPYLRTALKNISL